MITFTGLELRKKVYRSFYLCLSTARSAVEIQLVQHKKVHRNF